MSPTLVLLFFVLASFVGHAPCVVNGEQMPLLPPGVELVSPKELGLSEEEVDTFLGKISSLNAKAGNGPKTQILTVGFDANEKINLENFQTLPEGLSSVDKLVTDMAIKGLEKRLNQSRTQFGTKTTSKGIHSAPNNILVVPTSKPLAKGKLEERNQQAIGAKTLDDINTELHRTIMETMHVHENQLKELETKPKKELIPIQKQPRLKGQYSELANSLAPAPDLVKPTPKPKSEEKLNLLPKAAAKGQYPQVQPKSSPQPFPDKVIMKVRADVKPPEELILSPTQQPIVINAAQQQQILGDIQQQGPVVFQQTDGPNGTVVLQQQPAYPVPGHQQVQFVPGPIFVQQQQPQPYPPMVMHPQQFPYQNQIPYTQSYQYPPGPVQYAPAQGNEQHPMYSQQQLGQAPPVYFQRHQPQAVELQSQPPHMEAQGQPVPFPGQQHVQVEFQGQSHYVTHAQQSQTGHPQQFTDPGPQPVAFSGQPQPGSPPQYSDPGPQPVAFSAQPQPGNPQQYTDPGPQLVAFLGQPQPDNPQQYTNPGPQPVVLSGQSQPGNPQHYTDPGPQLVAFLGQPQPDNRQQYTDLGPHPVAFSGQPQPGSPPQYSDPGPQPVAFSGQSQPGNPQQYADPGTQSITFSGQPQPQVYQGHPAGFQGQPYQGAAPQPVEFQSQYPGQQTPPAGQYQNHEIQYVHVHHHQQVQAPEEHFYQTSHTSPQAPPQSISLSAPPQYFEHTAPSQSIPPSAPPQQYFDHTAPSQLIPPSGPPQYVQNAAPPQETYVRQQYAYPTPAPTQAEVIYGQRQPTPLYTTRETYSLPSSTVSHPGGSSLGIGRVEGVHKSHSYSMADLNEKSINYLEAMKYIHHVSPNSIDTTDPYRKPHFTFPEEPRPLPPTPSFYESEFYRLHHDRDRGLVPVRTQLSFSSLVAKPVSASYTFQKPRQQTLRFPETDSSGITYLGNSRPSEHNTTPRSAYLQDVAPSVPMIKISSPENAVRNAAPQTNLSPSLHTLFDQIRSESQAPIQMAQALPQGKGTHYNKNLDPLFAQASLKSMERNIRKGVLA